MSEFSRYDVLIIGGGFSGSILARVLTARGRRVALVDAASHPRFAIGESSTPLADVILKYLGQHYQVPEFVDLATYGSWKHSHPEVACGLKRGFSYYHHRPGKPFSDGNNAESSLLVAASRSDNFGDTHWYRADVDQFLFKLAAAAGVDTFSGRSVEAVDLDTPSTVVLDDGTKLTCEMLIDASGKTAVTARLSGAKPLTLSTSTSSVFAHYTGVGAWKDVLGKSENPEVSDPFSCDASAQHHLLDDGWLWVLRFDNAITSVGWTAPQDVIEHAIAGVDSATNDVAVSQIPAMVIGQLASRYPSLQAMMQDASPIDRSSSSVRAGRLQHHFSPLVSDTCVLLPTTAATIDPLHSTGIAHALSGVLRVAAILLDTPVHQRTSGLKRYAAAVDREVRLIDQLIATAYEVADDFQRFSAACMLYFIAVIQSEERFLRLGPLESYFGTDIPDLVDDVASCCQVLRSTAPTHQAIERVRALMTPWNTAGLFNPDVMNRYAYTATKP